MHNMSTSIYLEPEQEFFNKTRVKTNKDEAHYNTTLHTHQNTTSNTLLAGHRLHLHTHTHILYEYIDRFRFSPQTTYTCKAHSNNEALVFLLFRHPRPLLLAPYSSYPCVGSRKQLPHSYCQSSQDCLGKQIHTNQRQAI